MCDIYEYLYAGGNRLNNVTKEVLQRVKQRDPDQKEFLQTVESFLLSIDRILGNMPDIVYSNILYQLVEPERQIAFRVPWTDDNGRLQINRGFRVQMNGTLGPYKGGLRLHPSVNLSIIKFLSFEQTFKNALTGLNMGGAKGGSDFNPKGKSDGEVMRFCQSFMTELSNYIGPNTDVPAGDIGVGGREIGYLFGQYRRLQREFSGVLTGKGLYWGGSLLRPEATGYGLTYISQSVLADNSDSLEGKRCLVSGSGNVAQYTVEKLLDLKAIPLTLSDSNGMVFFPNGITREHLDAVKLLKNVRRGRIRELTEDFDDVEYIPVENGRDSNPLWAIPADIAFPAATQYEINDKDAMNLVENKVSLIAEGANMPCTPKAHKVFLANGVTVIPAKAANAGGVAVSGLEMAQNGARISWTKDQVDSSLKAIMRNIHTSIKEAAEKYSKPGNLIDGANIASFLKVASGMKDQGYI